MRWAPTSSSAPGPKLRAGLAQLLDKGAFYPDVRYQQGQVTTAPGHTVLSTGAYPWRTGVVGNRVMNRSTGKDEPVFWDPTHPVLDAPAGVEDVSPEALLAETLSDHLRLFTQGRGKSIALSGKARAAIALAGRLGQAYWFNEQVGRLVTGTAYMKELPAWLRSFNDRRLPDASFGTEWSLALPTKEYLGEDDRPFESPNYSMGRTFPHSLKGGAPSPGPPSYARVRQLTLRQRAPGAGSEGGHRGRGAGQGRRAGPPLGQLQRDRSRLPPLRSLLLGDAGRAGAAGSPDCRSRSPPPRRPPVAARTSWWCSPRTTVARRCPRSGSPRG